MEPPVAHQEGRRMTHPYRYIQVERRGDVFCTKLLPGTPCEDVMRGRLCHHPTGVKDRFPQAKPLVQLGVESYLGTPLLDSEGNVLGLLAVFDKRPMPS